MSANYLSVDVRDDLSRGREPFSRIMAAIGQLEPGQGLRLIAPFEPVPLYAVLAARGFSHTLSPQPDGSVVVVFDRVETPPAFNVNAADRLEIDARGLEPPEPMVRILEALAVLPPGAELIAHTDRNPMHLHARLEERGFTGRSEAQADGSYLTIIHHV